MVDKITTMMDDLHGKLPSLERIKRGDFGLLAKQMKKAGIQIIRTDPEIYENILWKKHKRPELAQLGVPELYLKIQDMAQKRGRGGSLNCVYHRKIMIIDDQISLLGSLNFGSDYLYEEELTPIQGNPRGIPTDHHSWHDGCLVIDSVEFAQKLNNIFAQQWMVLGGDVFSLNNDISEVMEDGQDMCAIFFSFPGNHINTTFSLYESVVQFSEGEVMIENPYILAESFWETLHNLPPEQAKKLRIITSLHVNDHQFVKPSFKINAAKPHKKGVRFYDYSECGVFSHWKVYVDCEAFTVFHGSTNLNSRSAFHDFEINVLVKSKDLFKEVKQQLHYDIASGKQITDFPEGPHVIDKVVTQLSVYFT